MSVEAGGRTGKLRVVIGHSHLQPGGVTSVIRSTLRAFAHGEMAVEVVLVSGREPPTGFLEEHDVPVVVVPELDYPEREPQNRSKTIFPGLIEAVRRNFGGQAPDVWHWHNPALGKNASTMSLLNRLAQRGEAVLFQHHDLAERGRPANFRLRETFRDQTESVFPVGPRLHHAFINPVDLALARKAGLPVEVSSILRNPVEGPSTPMGQSRETTDRPFWLYPVRATARKNLGEFLLYARAEKLRGSGISLAQSLPPTNSEYQASWQRWLALADELKLPVIFGLAEQVPWNFAETLERSLGVLTTSIEEGFGMALVEPWLHGRWVAGRDLPELTQDLRAEGLRLEDLRPTLPVSRHFFDEEAFLCRRAAAVAAARDAYGLPRLENSAPKPSFELWDFGLLDETAQIEVLRHPGLEPENLPRLPARAYLQSEGARSVIEANALRVGELFAPAATSQAVFNRLAELASAPSGPIESPVDPDVLLESCLPKDSL